MLFGAETRAGKSPVARADAATQLDVEMSSATLLLSLYSCHGSFAGSGGYVSFCLSANVLSRELFGVIYTAEVWAPDRASARGPKSIAT